MKRLLLQTELILLTAVFAVACNTDFTESTKDSDVLYGDDFKADSSGNWFTESDQQGSTSIINEEMVIGIEEANTLQFTTLREPTFGDFDLEVEATLLEGDLESSYGVLFQMKGPEEFYRFEITGDGRYMIERLNGDGTWTRHLDDWLISPAILGGLGATNRLGVSVIGQQLSFSVNGELLQILREGASSDGNIALDAGTFGQPGLRVSFDNLVIRRP